MPLYNHLVWSFIITNSTMPSFTHLLLFTILVTLALSAPAPSAPQKRGQTFKVKRVANPNFVRRDGAAALIKAYRKFGMPLPTELAATIERKTKHNGTSTAVTAKSNSTVAATNGTGSGTVAATPESGDVEYLSPVNIGGQTMNMDFDSGSSDLWVFNTQLATASQAGHTVFNPTKSTTFKLMQGASFSISYGDGSGAAGNVGIDTVNIGGATVTNQAVELATAVATSFVSDMKSNGLVGLAFSKLNTVKPTQQKTFFDNAMPTLAEPVFTADLRHASAGAYEFGTIDSTRFNGSLSWAAINTTQGFWQFSSSKFSIGSGGTVMNIAGGGQAIADTGTTLMLVDPAIVNAYYSQVQGAVNNDTAGGVTFPCNANLPDLNVDVGGNYMALIRGSDIKFEQVDADTCFGGVQATTSSLQIYGDIMFKSQFVAFNGGNNSIGMAPHQ